MRNRNKRSWLFLTRSEAMPVMTGLGGSEDRQAGGDAEEERHHGDGGGGVHRAGGEDGSEGEDWSVMAGNTALGSERVGVVVGRTARRSPAPD